MSEEPKSDPAEVDAADEGEIAPPTPVPSAADLDAPASRSQPLIIRGIADLEAEEVAQGGAPRDLSSDAHNEDATAPGLRVPTNPGPVPTEFEAKPEREREPGSDTAPISLDAVARSSDQLKRPPPKEEFPFAKVNVPPKPPKGVLRRLGPTVLCGVVAFLIMSWIIVSQWVPPTTALVFMAAGMAFPTLLVAIMTSTHSTNNLFVRALPALLLGAGGIVAGWTWGIEDVRAGAVPFAPDQIRSMEKMFADSSMTLSVAACRRYAPHYKNPAWWNALFGVLNARPDLATTCLKDMPEEAASMIGGALADRWAGELVAEGAAPPEERACSIATGLAHLPIPPAESSAGLLACNRSAEMPYAQQCCGRALHKSLKNEEELARLIPEIFKAAPPESKVGSAVFAMSFHGQGLTPEQTELRDALKFNSFLVQAMALEEACRAIPAKQHDAVDHMRAALDQHCKVKVEHMPKDSKQWASICNVAVAEIKGGNGLDPMSTLCSLNVAVSVPDAIAEARRVVRRGIVVVEPVH